MDLVPLVVSSVVVGLESLGWSPSEGLRGRSEGIKRVRIIGISVLDSCSHHDDSSGVLSVPFSGVINVGFPSTHCSFELSRSANDTVTRVLQGIPKDGVDHTG